MTTSTTPAELPTAVLVDVDGTVATITDRGPFDWGLVSRDAPVPDVIAVVTALRAAGHRVLFCTGRSEESRRDTEAWLAEHVGRTEEEPVLMRRRRDFRKDVLTKAELFEQHVAGRYRVVCVLEDRPGVVAMWRERGLTVLQVADGG
ncbi:hypothetical protein SAMN05445756_0929 [Kytococcus aerolatus]|uniref:Polynucleotide kinase PNKP phosphatase domain-containing protein n=1 Tax=Kytococcus aerolatus TaxID=592308 RepID=A0A212TC01_9MICO|nr:hypothetical protein [Kytococcus aerolatus]SNC63552.1 hypothetical protein SAMN05445756_0929 [Kytococcus aerolatus]